jgi:hypothetical protein
MPHAKQLSNRKRRIRAAPVLGAAGLLALASSASAEAMSTANTEMSHQLFLGEEEISDVSLSTFHVFDKQNVGHSSPACNSPEVVAAAEAAAAEAAVGAAEGVSEAAEGGAPGAVAAVAG